MCIHRDPAQLSHLQESGYKLATATNGSDGLRLLISRPVDAVVLEYHLGLLDGVMVADQIKKVRPGLPVVMLVDHLELPARALNSVDALVVKSDGSHFLLATVHFVLNAKSPPVCESPGRVVRKRRPGRHNTLSFAAELATDRNNAPFSRRVWQEIWNGTIQF